MRILLIGSDNPWRMEASVERALKRAGHDTLLDPYGAENEAEFFAVATECFYEQPRELKQEHPDLYAILRDFYRVDPAQWRTHSPE